MEKEFWEEALNILKKDIPEEKFELWLKPIKPLTIVDNKFKIAIPNKYFKDQLEGCYKNALEKTLSGLINNPISLDYVVDKSIKDTFIKKIDNIKSKLTPPFPLTLNPKYTFKSFVIGENNRFAHAASWAVAEKPGHAYNPLFIYGGVGLGKTHLMQAIGSHIFSKNPSLKIIYVSTEQFTNEFIDSIQFNQPLKFKEKYRNINTLLIDDIQFLQGKEQTQDEFFHTFNTLYESGRQMVLTSDRPPKDIPTIEERLRSRFESGLMTDIQPPDLETRIAILKRITENENIKIDEDILHFIAGKIKTNIRELEGVMIRVIARYILEGKKITLKIIEEILKDMVSKKDDLNISISTIQKKVAKYFNIKIEDIKAKNRSSSNILPRHIAMYLCKKLTNFSLPEIGREFGGKDHTTVLYACNKIEKRLQYNKDLKITIDNLSTSISE
ncbi:MAG: chromosomal replication initiator protein DnaA [bacterium]